MVHVTPASEHYSYTMQDFDEQQAVLCDLRANPRDYLAHPDGMVRSYADWTMHHYGISVTRDTPRGPAFASWNLHKLYKRLREVA